MGRGGEGRVWGGEGKRERNERRWGREGNEGREDIGRGGKESEGREERREREGRRWGGERLSRNVVKLAECGTYVGLYRQKCVRERKRDGQVKRDFEGGD